MENVTELGARVVRKVYLITYSRADGNVCDNRQRFANYVIQFTIFQRVTTGNQQVTNA